MLRQDVAMSSRKSLLLLFLTTFQLSAFTFGGGYVIVSLMKKVFVDRLRWIEQQEMLDLVAIAEVSPGSIAISGAIAVGYKLAGLTGLLVTVTATALPPLIIISLISLAYTAFRSNEWVHQALTGMQAGVAAVIFSVVCELGSGYARRKDAQALLIMLCVFLLSCTLDINVICTVLACMAAGFFVTLFRMRKKG